MASNKESLLSQSQLKELLRYDPDTGEFTWRVRRSSRAAQGDVAGCRVNGRYWVIRINGKAYLAHRLAWLYEHGRWPIDCIDHINGDMVDNRIANLREADNRRNQYNRGMPPNNRCGYKGVIFKNGRYEATIVVDGRPKYVGRYDDPESAGAAYDAAAKKHFGEFYRRTA